jgi:hypothetical protein
MGNLVYPANLPGLLPDVTRTPMFNTGVQAAITGKESRIAYQQYPRIKFELQYELLRDYVTPSDLKALTGLFMACHGKYDTFLFSDPTFNTVASMQFATTDGVTSAYPITATYQNTAGPGGAELIQNFNGVPVVYLNRFGFPELLAGSSRTIYTLYDIDLTNAAWVKTNCTVATLGNIVTNGASTSYPCSVFTENTASSVNHFVSQGCTVPATTGLDYTFSGTFFPSARGWAFIQLTESTGSHVAYCFFNISTGPIGTSATTGANWSNVRVSSTPLVASLGWFKCTITATKNSAGTTVTASAGPAIADNTLAYAGSNGTQAIYGWGLQLENSSTPTATVITTGATITQADYALGATGIVTTALVYTLNLILSWTGSFFYRCRFDDDSFTVTQFLLNFWANKKVTFLSVKL